MSSNAFKSVIDIDLLGTFNIYRAAVGHAVKPGASFVAITAPQGTQPHLFQAHVCAAKARGQYADQMLRHGMGQIRYPR